MKYAAPAILVAAIFACNPASAAHWRIDYARSKLGFTVSWSNEPFSGSFKHWSADVDFDPTDPSHGHAVVKVDLASETSDEADFDSGLKGAQGFETSRFPSAVFMSKSLIRTGTNSFLVQGTLSLHGISREISLPFVFTLSGPTAHVVGTAHVLRTDFGVGSGAWSAPTPVSHDVAITVDLTAAK